MAYHSSQYVPLINQDSTQNNYNMKDIKPSSLIGLFLLLAYTTCAQVIPENKRVDWSQAGLIQEIPSSENIISVMDFGATGNGINNDSPAVIAALEDLNNEAGVLFFPPGTYLLNQPISTHSNLTIKGAGADETHLLFFLSSDNVNSITTSASQSSSFSPIISGYSKGSIQIVVEEVSDIQSGDFIEIQQENGDWDISPASWAANSVGQVIRVASLNNNEIILEEAIRIDYDAMLNPVFRKIEPIENVKIENLKIERYDAPDDGGAKNFYFAYAVNCQVSGVESVKSQGSHIYATHSSNLFFFGNYLHDAFIFDGTDTRGYGITLNMHTGNCLIENNIFKNLRHAMMVKTGANGNVFSYNYSREPHRSEPINDYSGDISVHGHYAYANLFEENIVQNIIIDHYWGPGGPWNTFFRNRTELYGLIMTTNSELETAYQNFVGNEITNNFPYGFYTLTGQDHFEYGNNDGGNAIPSGTSDLNDYSYFYAERPWFLESAIAYPGIGYPNSLSQFNNPAKERWLEGGEMTVSLETAVGIEDTPIDQFIIRLLGNPVKNELHLEYSELLGAFNYKIYDLHGRLQLQGTCSASDMSCSIQVGQLAKGIYFIEIKRRDLSQVLKFNKQ